MHVSTLTARPYGFLLLLIAGAAGCAQSGAGVPASLTAPSSLVSSPSATAAGPSVGYDATGTWLFTNTDVHGNVDGDPFVTQVIQDPGTGNLSLTDEDGVPVTLERLSSGGGTIITYRLSSIGHEDNCDISIKGTARLDTTTNTVTMPIRLRGLTCSGAQGGVVIGTKLS